LFAIDEALGEIVVRATEPALAAIKLAWWQERLEELDEGKVPAEPRLQAAAQALLPRGITGVGLAGLEDGWAVLLDESPDGERVAARGLKLFGMAVRLLECTDPLIGEAGRLFGHLSAMRRGLAKPPSIEPMRPLAGHRFGRRVRPLTAIAALAARDARQWPVVEPEATPGRALVLLRHRFTGRID